MLRAAGFLVLLTLTHPLFAQWEVRSGLRAGYAVTNGADGPAFGAEGLLARGPAALSANLDYYDAGDDDPGAVTAMSLDALWRFRLRRERAAWVAVGWASVEAASGVGSDTVWVPSAGFSWPLGKRQLYVTVRHHNAARSVDPRFRPVDLNTTLFMVGFRSTNLLEW